MVLQAPSPLTWSYRYPPESTLLLQEPSSHYSLPQEPSSHYPLLTTAGALLGRRLRLPSPHAQRGRPLGLRGGWRRAARSSGAADRRGRRGGECGKLCGECGGAGGGGGGGVACLLRWAPLPAPRLSCARPQAPHQRDPYLREGARPTRQPLCAAAMSNIRKWSPRLVCRRADPGGPASRADSLEKFFGRTAAEQQAHLQEVARGGES